MWFVWQWFVLAVVCTRTRVDVQLPCEETWAVVKHAGDRCRLLAVCVGFVSQSNDHILLCDRKMNFLMSTELPFSPTPLSLSNLIHTMGPAFEHTDATPCGVTQWLHVALISIVHERNV